MNRAYSVLTIKAVDQRKRVITGIATTPTVDRVGDIIEPLGCRFVNPLPFLWQHQHDKPIGTCVFGTPTEAGIPFTATLAHPDSVTSTVLKERFQEAWDSISTGLVRATSIGFRPIEYSHIEGGGIRFTETEVFELSAVTIPAQAEAIIDQIKSAQRRAGSSGGGRSGTVRKVHLTEQDRRRAQIVVDSRKRIAARDRVGIPRPVVKLTAEDDARFVVETLLRAARATREKRQGAPVRVVKL